MRILLLLLLSLPLISQEHLPVLPGLSGNALINALDQEYSPDFVFPQGMARDTLMARIYNENGTITGVYSGFQITVDLNEDPTQDAFAKGINTEHTFPRSRLTDGPSEWDMHHLTPTRVEVNSARGSFPFRENVDTQTDVWFRNSLELSSIPSNNIDEYSEFINNVGFEPREDWKGNVARIYFYMRAVWPSAIDQGYFDEQVATLCDWHLQDPVDLLERERTYRIAQYQGTPNPFVLDCTLPQRSFCANGDVCTPSALTEIELIDAWKAPYPNPAADLIIFEFSTDRAAQLELSLFDSRGRELRSHRKQLYSGEQLVQEQLPPVAGMYFYRLRLVRAEGVQTVSGRVMVR